jgi:omega-amidase
VGVNRVGTDGNGVEYSGNSAIISPKGDQIFSVEGMEAIKTIELSSNSLLAYRDKFPAFMDADDFSLEIGEYEERDELYGLS